MTPIEEMTDEQFEQYTLSILEKELGPIGLARYLRAHGTASTDYTRDRHQWLEGISFDQLVEKAREVEAQSSR